MNQENQYECSSEKSLAPIKRGGVTTQKNKYIHSIKSLHQKIIKLTINNLFFIVRLIWIYCDAKRDLYTLIVHRADNSVLIADIFHFATHNIL